METEKLLKQAEDPNCLGVTYRIPWGKITKDDNKKLTDLLCSPGYYKMHLNTHKSIESVLSKYVEN